MITPTLKMSLLSIQVGLPRTLGSSNSLDINDRMWTTGFFKEAIHGPVEVSKFNLHGDGQADLEHHGGVDKAVCCYPHVHWPFWESDLGFPLPLGAFGENFTVSDCDETDVCIGDIFTCGTAIFQLSQPRQPCWKLARRWRIKDLAARVEQTGRTGWYFRVLQEGVVEPASEMILVERLCPEFTVARANEVMHKCKKDWNAAARLASCSLLSESWKRTLSYRARLQEVASSEIRLSGET
jgi:MOSC domain-containing protein YiiM